VIPHQHMPYLSTLETSHDNVLYKSTDTDTKALTTALENRHKNSKTAEHKIRLENVSISEPLQNRQHAQTPYLGQIWHASVGQWSMLTGLISCGSVYCLARAGKNYRNVTISTIFSHFLGSYVRPPLSVRAKFGSKQQTHGLRLHAIVGIF